MFRGTELIRIFWGDHETQLEKKKTNYRVVIYFVHQHMLIGTVLYNALQYSCLGDSMDREAWQAMVHGVARVRHDLATKPLYSIA